jgi:purine-nucleoside phosphorylase
MDDAFDTARRAAEQIAELSGVARHDIALTLGSGWAAAADQLGELVVEIEAETIEGFSRPTVSGHVGTLRSVRLPKGKHALIIGARTHLYEGRGAQAVAHGVRTAAACGATTMVLTNGAGGISPQCTPGTAVLIRDHINLTGHSPLEGATFVDLTDLYTPALRELARRVQPDLPEGVYVQFPGPQYETPAEIVMARTIGADMVGMSTALEAIAARHQGMQVLGLSLITNPAAGTAVRVDGQAEAISHAEVLDAGREAAGRLGELLARIVHTWELSA